MGTWARMFPKRMCENNARWDVLCSAHFSFPNYFLSSGNGDVRLRWAGGEWFPRARAAGPRLTGAAFSGLTAVISFGNVHSGTAKRFCPLTTLRLSAYNNLFDTSQRLPGCSVCPVVGPWHRAMAGLPDGMDGMGWMLLLHFLVGEFSAGRQRHWIASHHGAMDRSRIACREQLKRRVFGFLGLISFAPLSALPFVAPGRVQCVAARAGEHGDGLHESSSHCSMACPHSVWWSVTSLLVRSESRSLQNAFAISPAGTLWCCTNRCPNSPAPLPTGQRHEPATITPSTRFDTPLAPAMSSIWWGERCVRQEEELGSRGTWCGRGSCSIDN